MQEFAPNVGPELMQQVLAGIAQKGETNAARDRMHSLALARNIKIGNGTRRGDAEDPRGIKSLATTVRPRNQNAAHGIQRTREERQIRIAEISGVLLEHRGKKKALEKNVRLIGGQIDAIALAHTAEAGFIFAVQVIAFGAVCSFIDGRVGEGARRIGAVQKYVELLPCRERLPFIKRWIGFAVDGAVHP